MGRGKAQPLGRAHNYGSGACSYSELYLGKPSQSPPRQRNTAQNRALRFPTCRVYAGVASLPSVPSCASLWLPAPFLPDASLPLSMICRFAAVSAMNISDGGLWLPPSCTSADGLELPDKRREEERDASPVAWLSVPFPLVWQSTAALPGSSPDGRLSETGVRTSPVCPLAVAEGLT